jgi:hypothetical protein
MIDRPSYLFRHIQLALPSRTVPVQLNHTNIRVYEYTNLRMATETRPTKWAETIHTKTK